jgi:4-alpha-glucanotransferase
VGFNIHRGHMQSQRASGVILHLSSLPGPFGIGDLGPSAIHWLDWMDAAGFSLWQILPLNPTGYGNSPYQSYSAFAGNSFLISPILLVEDGLVPLQEVEKHPHFASKRVDFHRISKWKRKILKIAFRNYKKSASAQIKNEFESFRQNQSYWLKDFSTFMALKEYYKQVSWNHWPDVYKFRDDRALAKFSEKKSGEIKFHEFVQFCFERQWQRIHAYAQSKNIRIIGDLPIYMSFDSADVWTHPELFELDSNREARLIAGVPPDYFSPTGQLWGNPLYRWPKHQETKFDWWVKRFEKTMHQVDLIRLDHFRGFSGYWEVQAGMTTAEKGRWVKGPGNSLFNAVKRKTGNLSILAEDLGVISIDVEELRKHFNFPGMRILQFAFSSDANNAFLPHNYPINCAAYTGTHDNPTSKAWYKNLSPEEAEFCQRYLHSNGKDIVWGMLRCIWSSVAEFAIAPMQDFLELGEEARMNYPGRVEKNWAWRLLQNNLNEKLAQKINDLNRTYARDKNQSFQNIPGLVIHYQEYEEKPSIQESA